ASALVPSPGGFGSLDAALTAAIIAAGQSPAVALAAVLGYRLVTVWLPMAPSACVLALMVRRGHL
ncbi:lysylphosphatidylglycerol synthase domain-containing protein, partial [Frankia sp. AvcI1]